MVLLLLLMLTRRRLLILAEVTAVLMLPVASLSLQLVLLTTFDRASSRTVAYAL